MVDHVRKLLYEDSSSSPPLISPPPPSIVYNEPKQFNDFSPYLIPLFFALGAAFLVVAYFTFVKKYYLSPSNQRRTASENLDENDGSVIDHPIWLINTIGLEQSIIDSIPVFKYEKNEGLIEGTMCSICLSEFVADETLRLLPKCSHAFHMLCIDTWLSSHKNCPTCRAPIVRELAVTIQIDDSGSNPNNLTPLEEAPDANMRNFGDVECYQRGGENEEILAKKSPSLGYGFRVFSDLGGYREKVEAEQEQVRRSISMDPSSASSVYRAMTNIHELEVERAELLQASDEKAEKSEEGVNGSSRISKIMKSSSVRFSLRKGPISMKRSSSSGGN